MIPVTFSEPMVKSCVIGQELFFPCVSNEKLCDHKTRVCCVPYQTRRRHDVTTDAFQSR